MVELLVVLGILAALAVGITASVRIPKPASADPEDLIQLVAKARSQVVLSGRPETLLIEPGQVSFRGAKTDWAGVLQVGSALYGESRAYSLLIHPDGTFSGDRLFVRANGRTQTLPGVYRAESFQ